MNATHEFPPFKGSAADLAATLEMAREAAEFGDPRLAAYVAHLEASSPNQADVSMSQFAGATEARALHSRREAGSAHRNQYGECKIRYASEKQVAFLESLLARKDLSGFQGSTVVDIAAMQEQVATGRVNLRTASALIERLMAQPDRTDAAAPAPKLASEKQVAFATRLLAEREVPAAVTDFLAANPVASGTGKQVSDLIERLLALPKAEKPATEEMTREHTGPWVAGDKVFRVYLGRQSGRMLAKVWNGETKDWDYAGQADRFVNPTTDHKMTREEAMAWGQNSGNCAICGADLDDPESVDRGIGPVCYRKYA